MAYTPNNPSFAQPVPRGSLGTVTVPGPDTTTGIWGSDSQFSFMKV